MKAKPLRNKRLSISPERCSQSPLGHYVLVSKLKSALAYLTDRVETEDGYQCDDGHNRLNRGNIVGLIKEAFPDMYEKEPKGVYFCPECKHKKYEIDFTKPKCPKCDIFYQTGWEYELDHT